MSISLVARIVLAVMGVAIAVYIVLNPIRIAPPPADWDGRTSLHWDGYIFPGLYLALIAAPFVGVLPHPVNFVLLVLASLLLAICVLLTFVIIKLGGAGAFALIAIAQIGLLLWYCLLMFRLVRRPPGLG